jgi:hypothetical protein
MDQLQATFRHVKTRGALARALIVVNTVAMTGCGGAALTTHAGSPPSSGSPRTTTLTSQTISFTTNPPPSAAYNSQFTIAATASSGMAVTFSSSGACTNAGATYTMTGATGVCLVVANASANADYAAAPQLTQSVAALSLTQAFPTFPVRSYGASGSSNSFTCTGQAGSNVVNCTEASSDFVVGQGIRIVAAGGEPVLPAITKPPIITPHGTVVGHHTYCYIAYIADPFEGITSGSPPSCENGEPDLSYTGTYNELAGDYLYPLNATLWYRSVDNGPYRLIVVGHYARDVGQQPSSNGGWPDPLPADGSQISKNEDMIAIVTSVNGNQIVLSERLVSTVSNTLVDHDDTVAIQSTINAAVEAGGGTVFFGDGTFNIRRPTFLILPSPEVSTTVYSQAYVSSRWVFLVLPKGSSGNVFFQGDDASTILVTPPTYDNCASVFGLGIIDSPAWPPSISTSIEEVGQRSTTVTLANDPGPGTLSPGTDIWLYSGAFNPPCVDQNGSPYGNCHYSELNTIAAVNGRQLTLAYPTSKRYYDDGVSSFGMVALPVIPHNIVIQDITFDTSDSILGSGLVYGLLINHVVVNRDSGSSGAFGGGYKRDVVIENSTWSFGRTDGDGWYDEYDQFTDLKLLNNAITGRAPPGVETGSQMAKLYMSEGTSEVNIEGNVFDHASLTIDQTTDDIVQDNVLIDAILTIGDAYYPTENPLAFGNFQNASFASFDSQDSLTISNNAIMIGTNFAPSWVIRIGHFTAADITDNVIYYSDAYKLPVIESNGGTITTNTITFGPLSTNAFGIAVYPDEAPNIAPSSFDVTANTIIGASISSGIYVTDPGFTDTAPVCIQGNIINIGQGATISMQNPNDIVQSCQY